MRITDDHLATLREDGYIVVENFLTADELSAARQLLDGIYPSWEQLQANPRADPVIAASPPTHWALKQFPNFPAELHLNVLKHELTDAAKRFIGGGDIVADQSAISAKYAGQHTEDQSLHADYADHSLIYPSDDCYLPGMMYYVDVTADMGATRVVSRKHTRDLDLVPNIRPRAMDPEIYEHERAIEGPAGTLLLYTLRTFHRGAAFTAPEGVRLNHHFTFRPARTPWVGWSSWPMLAGAGEMRRLMQMCDAEQRSAMGFPNPGDAYWTAETLAGVQRLYPDMDLAPDTSTT